MSIKPASQYLSRIALQPAADQAEPAAEIIPGETGRIRYESFSPVEEYAVREGITEPLDEEFHAVLSNEYNGAGTVTAAGITIKAAALVGPANVHEGITYWHPDSNLCNRLATGPLQVRYTFNPARPQVVHLWSMEWVYLETLPAKIKAPVLDNRALAEVAKHSRRQIKRITDHAQMLHRGDTADALAALTHNASAMDRVAVQLPLPPGSEPAPRQSEETGEPANGFQAARRDTGLVLEQVESTRRLIESADEDFIAVRVRREQHQPVIPSAFDPLDDY